MPSRKGTTKPIVIDDESLYKPSIRDRVLFPTVDGERKGLGLVPRDYRIDPVEMFAPPSQMKQIPRSEWSARIKDLEAQRARLSDLRTWPSLDQNGQGYCLVPGMRITMADGSQKPVQRVRLQERVLTAEGRPGAVSQLHVRDYTGDVVWLEACSLGRLGLTPNHPVRTRRGFIPAGELTVDDWVSVEDGVLWRPVRVLDRAPDSGLVHNLGVEGDHSYQAEGIGVHNCWAYSTTGAVMLLRTVMNVPYVRLSGHAIGCTVMNYQNQGGWCGLSAKFHREKGCPSVEYWPEQSMSRDNSKPATWDNAALHKVTEDWVDLTRPVQLQNLTFDQVATCLLSGVPCATDFNWWGHSVCSMDLVEVEAGSFGLLILNSWSDSWGSRGTGILRGNKAIPDGAVALRVTGASPT